MTDIFKFKKGDLKIFGAAFLIAVLAFSGFFAYKAYAVATTVTVTIASSLTFALATDNFGTLTPATPKYATTTLSVTTNNSAGWNVTLSGDDVAAGGGTCDLDADASVNITDLTPQWIEGAATTTAGNAATITSGQDALAFRVMTASSTNGQAFISTTWWGTVDQYPGTSLWAGVASSTVGRKIGNAGTGSYSANAHLNTVLYYLDVPTTQQTGAYSCPLTYTTTPN